ncbi:hypothetical protein [Spirillospora sp. NBC_01491]|uniref:hypothetical protein n=1 Tax=Spirillospora sp. NBC_01491 TaxID=2976007 RepID=UPI002E326EB6|nr:hypothetical protein [Spirillospora sp. NBC_01491]
MRLDEPVLLERRRGRAENLWLPLERGRPCEPRVGGLGRRGLPGLGFGFGHGFRHGPGLRRGRAGGGLLLGGR